MPAATLSIGVAQHLASQRSRRHEALLVHIKAAHAASKGEHGWPRIWKELRASGVRVGKERIRRLMKQHGIKAGGKRKFVVTTDSRHNLPIAPNLLAKLPARAAQYGVDWRHHLYPDR